MRRKLDALRTVVRRPGQRVFDLQLALVSLFIFLSFCSFTNGALAQGQSDRLGQQLGTASRPSSTPDTERADKGTAGEPIRLPMTVRAGQSAVLRAGAASLTTDRQNPALSYRVAQEPACGEARETSWGIIVKATQSCVGQVLKFDYEVSAVDAAPSEKRSVRVAVEAVVQSGIESCGIANAPFEFIRIPGGTYVLQDVPPQLSDVAVLTGARSVTVEPFCITEEAVPASEMEDFLASWTAAERQARFPETLTPAVSPFSQFEMGRGGRPPALSVSYRMAQAYAQQESSLRDNRQFHLPRLEQYVAAAVYLSQQQSDAPSTGSFLVSLRGGLLEWTETPCNTIGTFVVLGTKQQSGSLDRYCYDASQALARMGFRLVSATPSKSTEIR